MRSKLQAIAETFVREVGSDLQRYTFVFPNHRAGLFFRKYLSQYTEKPIFAPCVLTINECFSELSELIVTDQLTLLLRLYSEYQRIHPKAERLDEFIYWGKMMLADFSEIDNHMVQHVEALFASISDLHAIEERFAYLTDNQRKALSRFWREYEESNNHHADGYLHKNFKHTWDLLFPLYTALRSNLMRDGLAYEGMLHREVLEHWDAIPAERFRKQYVFLGFNALTASERELMLRLQAMGKADFYFDYDSPYLRDPQNKASLFMEENLRLFRSRFAIPGSRFLADSSEHPQLHLVSVSSTVGEVHEVYRILSNIVPANCQDLTRTAVVLPDEQLLIPLLNAFPESVAKINVTMGYPLRATSLYMPVAYAEQYFIPMPETAGAFLDQMRAHILAQRNDDNSEGIYQLIKVLDRLTIALTNYTQIAFTVADMQQLLKMLTLETTIPYVGEPLDGLQVMGVLETRALDFDNVIITDFNDELYPGRSTGNSFIPYVLRRGFDLPTSERQDAIFAYNFYRMLSYAKRVWFITNSSSDNQHSGEVSRYMHQLRLQYGVAIEEVVVSNNLTVNQNTGGKTIDKDQRLQELVKLSATSLSTYLSCQKQFYYRYVAKLQEPEPDESILVSDKTIGIVFHAIMKELYHSFEGKMLTATNIESLLAQVEDDAFWQSLAPLQDLQNDQLAERVVRTYVMQTLSYDYEKTPFQYIAGEQYIRRKIELGGKQLMFHGVIDRIDIQDGKTRVIDYKTGGTNPVYTTMEDVFGIVEACDEDHELRDKGQKQVLQTLAYCWLLGDKYPNMTPCLYPVRRLVDTNTPIAVYHKNTETPLVWDDHVKQEFEAEIIALLQEIYDMDNPYYPAKDQRTCMNCAFAQLCNA